MPKKEVHKDNRIIKGSIAAVLLLLLSASYFYDPVNYKIVDCSFKHMTGLSCPGCGLSRSFHSFAHFDLPMSFGFHLLGPIFFILLSTLVVIYSYEALTGKAIKIGLSNKSLKWILVLILAIWIIYWLGKMIGEIYFT